MRFDSGITDVPSAGTAVQISNTSDKVLWIKFKASVGTIYVGKSDVSSTNGYPVTTAAGLGLELDFGEHDGSVLLSEFWVDGATNGDDAAWAVILL
jgi:hypothetical protein